MSTTGRLTVLPTSSAEEGGVLLNLSRMATSSDVENAESLATFANGTCCICNEAYNTGDEPECPIKVECGHVFGSVCIGRWLHVPGRENGCPMCRRTLFAPADSSASDRHSSDTTLFDMRARRESENGDRVRGTDRFGGNRTSASLTRRINISSLSDDLSDNYTSDDDPMSESSNGIDDARNARLERLSLSPDPLYSTLRQQRVEDQARRYSVLQMVEQEMRNIEASHDSMGEYPLYSFRRNQAHDRLEDRFDAERQSAIDEGRDTLHPRQMQEALCEVRRNSANRHREAIQGDVTAAMKAAVFQTSKINASFHLRLHVAQWLTHERAQLWVYDGSHLQLAEFAGCLPRLWNALVSCWDNSNLQPLTLMEEVPVESLFKADLEIESTNPGSQAYPRELRFTGSSRNEAPIYAIRYPMGSHTVVNGAYVAQP